MAKLTIDEVEYDTDTFTEEQTSMYNEAVYISNLMRDKEYTLRILDGRRAFLTKALSESLSAKESADG